MNRNERLFWLRVQRKAASSSPDVAREILRAFEYLRQAIPEAELTRAIEQGPQAVLRLFDEKLLDTAFAPARREIAKTVSDATNYFARDIPKAAQFNVGFNVLSPRTIEAIRKLDTKVLQTLKDENVREVVRAYVENGLRDGVGPREVGRQLRNVIGLAPNQQTAVENFRQSLIDGKASKSLGYKLRDRRFDSTVRKGGLSAEQIEKMTEAYRRRFLAHNATTNARTATVDAMKEGQRLAWKDAIDRGIVDGTRLLMRWITVGDDRVRDEHEAMQGETVPFDGAYSNGETIPGESTFNCRCLSRVFLKKAA